jgi:chromosome segregation ATPase
VALGKLVGRDGQATSEDQLGLERRLERLESKLDQLARSLEDASFEIRLDAERRARILEARHQSLEARWRVMQEHFTELSEQVARLGREVNDRIELAVRGLDHTRETIAASIAYLRSVLRGTELFEPAVMDEAGEMKARREQAEPVQRAVEPADV